MLGFIPDEGTTPSIEYKGWRFTVVEIDDRRIEKVKAERLSAESEQTEKEEE